MVQRGVIIASPSTCKVAAEYLIKVDPVLAPIIERAGTASLLPHSNYYQSLVESIISQQLSVKAAAIILKRFLTLFPGANFPQPSQILEQDIETLRSVGLSRQKSAYIQDLAVKVIDKTVQFDHLDSLSNDGIIQELTQIKGVGIWTVHMFLMFCMGRLDVLPVGDLGIKNGILTLYGLTAKPTSDEIVAIANDHNWHPYASVASWYVWYSLDNKPAVSV